MGMFKRSHKVVLAGLAALAIAGVMTGCGMSGGDQKQAAASGNGQKVELKLAYQLPAEHHLSKSVEKFAKEVNERSKGQIDIKVYPAGQLYNDQNMNDALMSGGLDIGMNSTARWSMVVPALKVLDMPFVLTSYSAVDNALDGDLGKALNQEMEKKGVHPLIWADYGYVQFCNNVKKIEKPEDFQGMKIRSYSETSADIIQALGASPTTSSIASGRAATMRGSDPTTNSRRPLRVLRRPTLSNSARPCKPSFSRNAVAALDARSSTDGNSTPGWTMPMRSFSTPRSRHNCAVGMLLAMTRSMPRMAGNQMAR